jgi:hypothetical protein
MFTCPGASEGCMTIIHDFYSGKENGANLVAAASLELNNFRTLGSWFGEGSTKAFAAQA